MTGKQITRKALDRVGPYVSSYAVDTGRAMAACLGDLETNPDNPRQRYQLARAIAHHANRHGTSHEEPVVYLEQSAAAGHTKAMFFHGLMLFRESRAREAARCLSGTQASVAGVTSP